MSASFAALQSSGRIQDPSWMRRHIEMHTKTPATIDLLGRQALVEFGTIAQEDVDSLFFTDDPQEVCMLLSLSLLPLACRIFLRQCSRNLPSCVTLADASGQVAEKSKTDVNM